MFEKTLAASRKQREFKRKLEVLPVALGIHVLAFGFVLVAQLWAVPPVPETYTVVSFYNPPPVPVPAGGPSGRNVPPRSNPDPVRRHAIVQPSAVPDEPVKPVEPGGGDNPAGLVPGGDPDGSGDGVIGGVPSVSPAAGSPDSESETPRVISPEMKPPVAISRPAPVYPELARRVRKEGTVIVEAIIDRQGNVADARVLRDAGMGLGEAALQAVRAWRYEPALLDGRPMTVYLTVTVRFELRGAE